MTPKPAKPDPKPDPKPDVVADPPAKPTPPVKAVAIKNTLGEVYFTFGGAKLSDAARGSVAKAVAYLNAHPDTRVTIEGHTDSIGPADVNDWISKKRAEAVKDHLTQAGIDAARLDVSGFGFNKLKYKGTDQRNRRVEIVPIK